VEKRAGPPIEARRRQLVEHGLVRAAEIRHSPFAIRHWQVARGEATRRTLTAGCTSPVPGRPASLPECESWAHGLRSAGRTGCSFCFAWNVRWPKVTPVNLPNKLTLSRFGLTALFLWAVMSHSAWNDTLALAIFCFAGLTDLLDGRIARRRHLITNFGILMDPWRTRSHLFGVHCAGRAAHDFAAASRVRPGHLALRPKVEAWMVVIIVARNWPSPACGAGRLEERCARCRGYGKHKTISQIVASSPC